MLKYLQLQPFSENTVDVEVIEFTINTVDYMAVFAHADQYLDSYTREMIEEKVGFDLPLLTYQFKFDLVSNIKEEEFFKPLHPSRMTRQDFEEMGRDLEACITMHREQSHADAYYVFAVRHNLYKFYGRMFREMAPKYNFTVYDGVGQEGLGYVIRW